MILIIKLKRLNEFINNRKYRNDKFAFLFYR